MAELVDALASGVSGLWSWKFESSPGHQLKKLMLLLHSRWRQALGANYDELSVSGRLTREHGFGKVDCGGHRDHGPEY